MNEYQRLLMTSSRGFCGSFGELFASPYGAIGTHVESGHLVRPRHVLDERAGKLRIAPTEAIDIVVAHCQPGPVLLGDVRQRRLIKGGFGIEYICAMAYLKLSSKVSGYSFQASMISSVLVW